MWHLVAKTLSVICSEVTEDSYIKTLYSTGLKQAYTQTLLYQILSKIYKRKYKNAINSNYFFVMTAILGT